MTVLAGFMTMAIERIVHPTVDQEEISRIPSV